MKGYVGVERSGMGMRFGVAEFAGTSAGIAHQHDRSRRNSVLASPTLTNVRTLGFFAHGCEFKLANLHPNDRKVHKQF